MEKVHTRELYSSPNGDRWYLCRDTSGKMFVLHQANIPAGGRISQIEVGDFLTRGYGPEQQALLEMIGSLIEPAPAEDSSPGELLTGEGDPGLAQEEYIVIKCPEAAKFCRRREAFAPKVLCTGIS
jgi:hypothetical protein